MLVLEKFRDRARERLIRNEDSHGYFHAQRVANIAGKIHEQ